MQPSTIQNKEKREVFIVTVKHKNTQNIHKRVNKTIKLSYNIQLDNLQASANKQ